MKSSDIAQARLSNQFLGRTKCKKPHEVVAWLGAVQAQDFPAAKWALGLRMHDAIDAAIEKAFNDGSILRTHVMRPTWHFVMPDDIRWMLALTAPRVKTILAHYDRTLEISGELLSRCYSVFEKALQGCKNLTRDELAKNLFDNGIPAKGQRLAHIVIHAELGALICSGPRRGKQSTYAWLDERVPEARTLNRDESLARLATTYFTSHGPAQMKDFAWWSGLRMQDAQRGLDAAGRQLTHEIVDGKTYWFFPATRILNRGTPTAMLLSIYDEYTIAYKDRSALGERYNERLVSMGNALTSVIILDGKIAGTWKRVLKKEKVEIVANLFTRSRNDEKEAVRAAADAYGAFLELPVVLSFK
jgi:hypothetical protein